MTAEFIRQEEEVEEEEEGFQPWEEPEELPGARGQRWAQRLEHC